MGEKNTPNWKTCENSSETIVVMKCVLLQVEYHDEVKYTVTLYKEKLQTWVWSYYEENVATVITSNENLLLVLADKGIKIREREEIVANTAFVSSLKGQVIVVGGKDN